MSDGRIMSGRRDGTVIIRMTGDLRFDQSARFEAFMAGLFAARDIENIVVDLNGVTNMDSTMLGLLVKLSRAASTAGLGRPVLLSRQEDVDLLLETMGVGVAFDIRRVASDPEVEMTEIPAAENGDGLPEHVLGAHRALMGLSDRNRRLFGPAVDMLEREVEDRGPL